jgi:pyruvate dehydrogenase E1 component beta subunit
MAEITFRDALRQAMREEMLRDESVFLMGEDIGVYGGCFQVTKGLLEEFGPERVMDTPISEAGFVGAAVGAAMMGMRPVVELQFADFLAIALDQLINSAAKMRYMHGGRASVPMVVRMPFGAGRTAGVHHSQSPEAWALNAPGLKIVMPSTPSDAKGLLKTSIRDPNPVLFFENKLLYGVKGDVPDGDHLVPMGKARILRSGTDVTVVALGLMVREALQAAERLVSENIEIEVLDPRTVRPLDIDTIVESVMKTTRLVIVHEAPQFGGVGAEIAAQAAKEAFGYLDAPIERVAAPETPVPFNPILEEFYMPNADKIVDAVKGIIAGSLA